MRLGVKALAVVALIILIPAGALAQAVIAGSVRDPPGRSFPASPSKPPVLRSSRRSAPRHRRQRAVPHRRSSPGRYTVTFTLPGFSTFKREGIELTGSFTATINADMRVGASRNGHRHRREPDRGRAERAAGDVVEQRRAQGRSRPCAATTRWSSSCPAS